MKPSPKISLFASAVRPQFWQRFYTSLLHNELDFEVCFVGPNPPDFVLPNNFNYFQVPSNLKPAQCYEIAARMCRGELIGWTADDANYDHPDLNCRKGLDILWSYYTSSLNREKLIMAQKPYEDGSDMQHKHHFFHGESETPMMAPLGFMNREWFFKLGGYDKNFVCGQAENDIVMRALIEGGRVEVVEDSKLYLHHKDSHGHGTNYSFRNGYVSDREYLENCWVKEGFGTYQAARPCTISSTRLRPFERFEEFNLFNVNQGPVGSWV